MAELNSDRLTAAYMAQVAAIRERVLTFSTTLWQRSTALRDVDVDRLVARIVPVVQGGQMQVASITNAYVQRLAALEGITATPVAIDRGSVVDYRGVPAAEVYRRPAVTAYTELRDGKDFQAAKNAGLDRLRSIVSSDIQQARNRQARAAYSSTGFDYTLRVLSGAENCALCVIASTQRYLTKDLQPMHPGCDCGERGVRANRDPGQVIDPRLLELTHQQVEAKTGVTDRGARQLGAGKFDEKSVSDYTELIITREHGEYGPTLAWRSDRFTGPSDIH